MDIVVASDLHLADGAWTTRPNLVGDAYRSLTQIVDYCLEWHLPLVLAGDLWDVRRPSASAVVQMRQQMDRMEQDRLAVYYIQGQHELDRSTAWMGIQPWAEHIDRKVARVGSEVLYGLDWYPATTLQAELTKVPPEATVLVMHQVWREFMGNIGHPEGSFQDIPAHIKLVITGDYHVARNDRMASQHPDGVLVISPGSTCMQEINEPCNKSFFRVRSAVSSRAAAAIAIPLQTRPYLNFHLTTPAELDCFCDHVATWPALDVRAAELPLVRVRYRNDLPDVYARLMAAVSPNKGHLFLDVDANAEGNETVVDVDAAPVGAYDSMLGALEQLSPPDGETCRGARRLLESDDPADELARMYTEFAATWKPSP